MYSNTADHVLNGILRNPTSSPTALRAALAEVRSRLDAGTLELNTKEKLVHALSEVKDRLDG